jgi:hypothetical protein
MRELGGGGDGVNEGDTRSTSPKGEIFRRFCEFLQVEGKNLILRRNESIRRSENRATKNPAVVRGAFREIKTDSAT